MQIQCPNCKYEGQGRHIMKGSLWIEILLWLLVAIPGLIYSIWRLSKQIWTCPKCDFENVKKIDAGKGIVWGTVRQSLLFWIVSICLGVIALGFLLTLLGYFIPNKSAQIVAKGPYAPIKKVAPIKPITNQAEPEAIQWEDAEKIVKNLPCSKGGTVDQYLTKKAQVPAVEDLGWNVYPRKDGFEVERLLLLDQRMSLEYRWHVDLKGKASPVNGKAIGVTAQSYAEVKPDAERPKKAVAPPRQYEIGYTIRLHNPSDTTVAIHKDESLGDITNIFTNGINAVIMESKKFPDKPIAYKVRILLKDGSKYVGWISGNIISR